MIVAIPVTDCKTDALIDERFARCPCFCFYNTDTKHTRFIENDKQHASSGAGPQVAAFLAGNGVQQVYAMEVGPKAQMMLSKLNIRIELVNKQQTIQEIIKKLNP